ncbi:MAG: hypothetical protein IT337_04360 [Thermomicrobiales bacterium]|nr:hypothetical protein [Thermomicrobiales bacterium]
MSQTTEARAADTDPNDEATAPGMGAQPAPVLETGLNVPGVPMPEPWFAIMRWGAVVLALVGLVLIVSSLRLVVAADSLRAPLLDDRDWVWTVAGAILLVMGVSAAILRPELGNAYRQLATSAVWSVALLLGIATVWLLINTAVRFTSWVGVPVTNAAQVETYLDTHLPPPSPGVSEPIRIPTGVMIQSVEFRSAVNVQVSGYVWQRYDKSVPDDVERGFVLPEAVAEAYSSTKAYQKTDADGETIGWYFSATLRQYFDYRKYPFDRQNVWLRLWHRDFNRGVILIPDFDAYFDITPTTLPGVEDQFVYTGWSPVYSGFSYRLNSYDSDFGVTPGASGDQFPELYFNFVLKRQAIGPLTDHLIYGGTVALLIFGLLILTTGDETLKGRFGLTTAGVLASVSALLFGVIIKHNQIRTTLETQQPVFLEVVPMILYFLLVLTALNAILVASPVNVRLLEYRHNLFPQLIYWPLQLGIVFLATLLVFYR